VHLQNASATLLERFHRGLAASGVWWKGSVFRHTMRTFQP
jgi:hypothetical protein